MLIDQRSNAAIEAAKNGRSPEGQAADGQASVSQTAGNDAAVTDDTLSPDEVRAQLQRILDSPAFEANDRRRRFLATSSMNCWPAGPIG